MMNEAMDPFEQRLHRQPVKPIPAEWRAEILSAAREAQASRHSTLITRNSLFAAFKQHISFVLWPHPKAWAGLATTWVLVLALQWSMRDKTPAVVEHVSPPSPEVIAELNGQQKFYAELMGSSDSRDADRPKKTQARPRTQRAEFLVS
jgi:hypothetical protein